MAVDLFTKFWQRVKPGSIDECWIWVGGFTPSGYARIWWDGKSRRANRVAWFLHYGVWPTLYVLHKCDNPKCVNINHLFLGTALDNMKDRDSKLRQLHGERNPHAKLNEDTVKYIRSTYKGEEYLELSEIYGVTRESISNIIRRKTWKFI